MYLPRAFRETDLRQLDALLDRDPFATLITVDGDGVPFATHLPVLYRRNRDTVLIEGHWARPNPQAGHSGTALLIVHGPHAYVSPSWYPDKDTAARVPTWNYAVAHLRGPLEPIDDEAALASIVTRLTERHEAEVGSDWRFEPDRIDHRDQLRGIVGFRFAPQRIDLKFKLNQNHPQENVAAVAAQLRSQDSRAKEVAALMIEQLDARQLGQRISRTGPE